MKKKLFYLLVVGAIVSLSSCRGAHECQSCDTSFLGKGYVKDWGSCKKATDEQSHYTERYCSSKCCFRGPGY